MAEYQSFSEEETLKIGQELAQKLLPGTVVALTGDLGAGKSVLARGIARGLGITGPIPSPTFTILIAYNEGRLPLYHFDWYRIQDEEELYEIGAEEYLYGQGVSLIEWPSKGPGVLPGNHVEVNILKGTASAERTIKVNYKGGQMPL